MTSPDNSSAAVSTPSTLVQLLRWRALHQPARRAYTFLLDGESEETSITYIELERAARTVCARLESLDARGKRALLLYHPGLEYIAAFFGCLYAGVIAVPCYLPRLNRPMSRLQLIASDAQATFALTTVKFFSKLKPQLDQTPDLARLRWLPTDRCSEDFSDGDRQEPALDGATIAFLQYTSGSTGTPKGVVLTHGNLLDNLAHIHRCFENRPDSHGVIWLPPYHDMGLIGGLLEPLYGGHPVTLMSPISFLQRPYRWLRAISEARATHSGGPNFAYELCLRKITAEQRATLDLSSWEVAFTGAEPIRRDTLDKFTEAFGACGFRGEVFYPCYGLAEATLITTGGRKCAPPRAATFDRAMLERNQAAAAAEDTDACTLVSCGQAMPGHRVLIVNPETKEACLSGHVGEIWVTGPSVAQGYWNSTHATEETFRAQLDGASEERFLRTGDLGFFHDGELFITGRLKDLIILFGRNYYPQDIELTVEQSHPVLRPMSGAAFTVEVAGEEKLVLVQEVEPRRQPAADLRAEEVFENVRQAVAEEHGLQVHRIMLIKAGSIPKTTSGKIQRHTCRRDFLSGQLALWEIAEEVDASRM